MRYVSFTPVPIVRGPMEDYSRNYFWWVVSCGEWQRYFRFDRHLLDRSRVGAENAIRYEVYKAGRLVVAFERQVREDRDF